MMASYISIDAETNGLWGQPFQISAVVYTAEGKEIERVSFRCPIEGEINSWVADNVLPQLEGVEVTHSSLAEMLAAFGKWWMAHKEGATAMWHMGHVVEAYVFRLLVEGGHIGEWDAPYVPIELSMLLASAGEPADSVDSYMEKHGLPKPELTGGTHNALYDALVAGTVFFHLKERGLVGNL